LAVGIKSLALDLELKGEFKAKTIMASNEHLY